MKCQRQKFNLQRKQAYLNCAYMSPLMKKVENAGIQGIKKKRKPFHISNNDFFDETEILRIRYSKLIDNPEPKRVVIIPSVSYGLANVVGNLPFVDGEILICNEQFPSNVYPWLRLQEKGFEVKTISPTDSENRGESWNAKILDSITEKTRVVSVGHVHWSDGTLFQLEKIRERLDKVGGLLIIDGTQSVGALPFSIKKIRPDALICAGYKWLMGPYSIGLAYYGSAFDKGTPIEENWINRLNSDNFSGLVNYKKDYREMSLRYEVGEHSNFILVPMMLKAINQLVKWQPDQIQDYTKHLMAEAILEMKVLGYKVENERFRANHLFGIRLPNAIDIESLNNSLRAHRVSVSLRGDAIRVAPNVYNDEMDVRKLLKALKEPIFASKH
ncbi:aminotransferase class V-fold PLP-dependent enzyme [Ekhidna sp. To15]|uniref:aminotransferase class V-fold PLP-dependent enzyme n=1 Tax=Ekhidna sp. To15 TaxID=3395267 RepID=UPI003F5270E0